MAPSALWFAALIFVPAVALATWVGFAIARVEAQVRGLGHFEGLHFEIEPEAAQSTEGAR